MNNETENVERLLNKIENEIRLGSTNEALSALVIVCELQQKVINQLVGKYNESNERVHK